MRVGAAQTALSVTRLLGPLLVACVALAACVPAAVRPDLPAPSPEAQAAWTVRTGTLAQIDRFTFVGRVASGALGFKADLRWKQNADGSFAMRVAGPFGARAAELAGDAQSVQVRTGGDVTTTADPESWLEEAVGCRIPVTGLRWWALGLPAPDAKVELVLDGSGRAAWIRQSGWELAYTEYQPFDGLDLPHRIEARNGETRVLLIADSWSDLHPAPAP